MQEYRAVGGKNMISPYNLGIILRSVASALSRIKVYLYSIYCFAKPNDCFNEKLVQ